MKKAFFRFIFHRLMGWKSRVAIPDYDKCIICVAPHTSNCDFFIGKLFYEALGRQAGFMMKREWFFFPLDILLRAMGGIPVDRSKRGSTVQRTAASIGESRRFCLAITPEGTRKPNAEWKRGFYYIALEAKIPIVLAAIDYTTKTVVMEKTIFPSGDIEKDMREIKQYYLAYKDKGKIPQNFLTGLEE